MKLKKLLASALAITLIGSSVNLTGLQLKSDVYASKIEIADASQSSDVDMDGIKAFVNRMYRVCLNRTADEDGLNGWAQKLAQKEATGCSVAYGFVFSPEFVGNNPSNSDYVNYMYDAFFGREADEEGFNYWVSLLDSGATRESVFCGFANSLEFANLCTDYGVVRGFHMEGQDFNKMALVNLFVERLYNVILNRTCDSDGMAGWTSQLVTHSNTGSGVAYGFVFSPEFLNKNTCDSCFVETLYEAFLGRASDESGKTLWVDKLDMGYSREEIFNGFSGSPEFAGICSEYGIEPGSLSGNMGSTYFTSGTCGICGNDYSYPTPTLTATPTPTATPLPSTDVDVTQYTYEIIPFYENYYRYVLVKTNNPDPSSFALLDKDSKYYDGRIEIRPTEDRFVDIKYDDYDSGRFCGGYICFAGDSDGGELIVCQAVVKTTYYNSYIDYVETDSKTNSCKLYNIYDLLYDNCVDESLSLWENLDNVQSYLVKYSNYPIRLLDPDKPSSTPFSCLIAPYYQDQSVMKGNASYEYNDEGCFALSAYPYVLHSISFPGVMANMALIIEPDAQITWDQFYHYLVNIEFNGDSKSYGGQGNHGDYGYTSRQDIWALFPKHITGTFTKPDQFNKDEWYQNLHDYWNSAIEEMSEQYDLVTDTGIRELIDDDGEWNRIAGGYIYSSHIEPYGVENTWIDGRYCNRFTWEKGATFEDHPTADILITNMTYKNYRGNTLTGDVIYSYDEEHKVWVSYRAYGSTSPNNFSWKVCTYEEVLKNSPELILTLDQVLAMQVDRNTNIEPAHGIICDGTEYPGTPF